ncbi:MAG TPA: response regulator [Firmicutes bacterium]|nr:response regulator [Bacillota bacterium]
MQEKILLVDDEPNVLQAFERNLRKKFEISTAKGGPEGLETMKNSGPYAVVVSDLQMPGMDGIQFLTRVREANPETVRMMLTGNANLDSAIEAVNEGNVFRFMTKPCPPETLEKVIEAGMEQYRLVMAEKELLEQTLKGSVKVLTDIMSLSSPAAFGRATRVRGIMKKLAIMMKVENVWEFELAGMLSQTGCITLPTNVVEKIYRGDPLTALETRMFNAHPKIGYDLISNIPRLRNVADMILYQEKHYNGDGIPMDDVRGEDIPLGARALHVVLNYDTRIWSGKTGREALKDIREKYDYFDPSIIKALEEVVKTEASYKIQSISIWELVTEMVLAEDVRTTGGLLLIAKGQSVTESLKERLHNFAHVGEAPEHVRVLVRIGEPGSAD